MAVGNEFFGTEGMASFVSNRTLVQDRDTALHIAARHGHIEVFDTLACFMDSDCRNSHGQRPVDVATLRVRLHLEPDHLAVLEAVQNGSVGDLTQAIQRGKV